MLPSLKHRHNNKTYNAFSLGVHIHWVFILIGCSYSLGVHFHWVLFFPEFCNVVLHIGCYFFIVHCFSFDVFFNSDFFPLDVVLYCLCCLI